MENSTRALLIVAAGLAAFVGGIVLRGGGDQDDPTHGPIVLLDVPPNPPADRVPPLGQSGWFPVLWAIDKTVGLPAPGGLGEYPEHTMVARKFVMRLESGEFDRAARLVEPAHQSRLSAAALETQWSETLRRLGRPDALDGERRWSSAQFPQGKLPHTAPGASCVLSFNRDHERGSTTIRVTVVRGERFPAVTEFALERNGFRRDRD